MGLFSKETPTRVQLRTGKELACLTCGFDRFFQRHPDNAVLLGNMKRWDACGAWNWCVGCQRRDTHAPPAAVVLPAVEWAG